MRKLLFLIGSLIFYSCNIRIHQSQKKADIATTITLPDSSIILSGSDEGLTTTDTLYSTILDLKKAVHDLTFQQGQFNYRLRSLETYHTADSIKYINSIRSIYDSLDTYVREYNTLDFDIDDAGVISLDTNRVPPVNRTDTAINLKFTTIDPLPGGSEDYDQIDSTYNHIFLGFDTSGIDGVKINNNAWRLKKLGGFVNKVNINKN